MDTERNLLAALLAVQNDMVSLAEVQTLFPRWQVDPKEEFADWLMQQGKLAATDLPRLRELLHLRLEQFHGDVQAGLKSLSPAEDWQALTPSQVATFTGDTAGMLLPPAVTPISVPGKPIEKKMAPKDSKRRYVRLRLHAAGGIGQVFLARDTHLERDVALEELKPEATQETVDGLAFLLKKARVTGQLEHPGIVPVYELVNDEEGSVPYYVMRLLRGRTLSQAIQEYHQKRKTDEAMLERASLLNVFSTVCQTVAFAHARGIIHRDLKGANILLGDFGEVAVLDWGLAKKLSGEDSTDLREKGSASLDLDQLAQFERTLPGQVMGTPYYMSPEQATGEAVDVRSDVYSLGAILYEILTGQPPFAEPGNRELSIRELLCRINTDAPIKPRQLVAEVPPALEAICEKALAKAPAERYAGAGDLGKEVQRWLADEPVHAYPEPFSARIGRWARRNRVLVASAGVLLSATVIGLSIFTVLLNQEQGRTEKARAEAVDNFGKATRANDELNTSNEQLKQEQKRTEVARTRAEANFKKAMDVVEQYLTKIGEERLLNEPGLQDLRRELLSKARDFYADLAREQGNDAASRLILGEAQQRVAQIHIMLGERAEAVKVLEETRELFRDLLAKDPKSDVYRYNHAMCLLDLGGQFFRLKGPGKKAEEFIEKAQKELGEVVKQKPLPKYRLALADAHNSLAFILSRRRRTMSGPEADKLRQRALSEQNIAVNLWQKLVEEQPDNPEYAKFLAVGLGNLAALYNPVFEADEVEKALTSAIQILERLVEKHPRGIEYQLRLGGAYRNLGICHGRKGAAAEEEKTLRQAVKVRDKLARKNPHVPELQVTAADDHFQFANFLFIQGRDSQGKTRQKLLAESKEFYQRSIAIYQRLTEDYPEELRYLAGWGQSLNSMGDAVFEDNKIQAIPWYDPGIDKLEAALKKGEKSTDYLRSLAGAYEGRGLGRVAEGKLQAGLADLDRAVELHVGEERARLLRKRRAIRTSFVTELLTIKGDFASAAREIAKITAEPLTPLEKYGQARSLAMCAAMAHDVKSPLADKYAAEVVVLLRQAQKGGVFNDKALVKGVEDLNRLVVPLSTRADFRELLNELKKK